MKSAAHRTTRRKRYVAGRNIKSFVILVAVAFSCVVFAVSSVYAQERQNLIETGDFEPPNDEIVIFQNRETIGPFTLERCGDLSPGTTCPADSIVIADAPSGVGGKAARFRLEQHYERSEVRAQINGRPWPVPPPPVELWYGWRLFLPEDFDPTSDDPSYIIVSQWHQRNQSSFYTGAPTLLRISRDNTWSFSIKYQPDPDVQSVVTQNFSLGLIDNDKGRWTDWVMHVKWTKESDGFLRLWKNSTQVIGGSAAHQWEDRPTYWDTPYSPNFKMGMYKGDPWRAGQSPKFIFGDDYRLGNASATCNDVAPGEYYGRPGGESCGDYIVDNEDGGFNTRGTWASSTSVGGYYGSDYLHDGDKSRSSDTATWAAPVAAAGTYDVYMRWSAGANRPDRAPVKVGYDGGVWRGTVNQRVDGGTWVKLGQWRFAGGGQGYVRIKARDAGYTIADAVRWVKVN